MASRDTRQLGSLIKARREKLGLTQKQVAEKLNMSQPGYGHYERGVTDISALDLVRISEVLDTTPHYLLGWGDDRLRDIDELAAFYRGRPPEVQARVKAVLEALVATEPDPV